MQSGIRDNHHRGSVGEFLREHIHPNAHLSIVSAYFTIYAYEALRSQLNDIADLRFLFGDPQFLRNLDPQRDARKVFQIENDVIALQNRLQQKRLARECLEWIKQKVQIRSVKTLPLNRHSIFSAALA